MKKALMATALLVAFAAVPQVQASTATYNVTTTWYEPQTQPRDSIFVGSFDYDSSTKTVTGLHGLLSESMTAIGGVKDGYTAGDVPGEHDTMIWLSLNNQLVSWYDASLGGTFAATFKNSNTNTFYNPGGVGPIAVGGGDYWSPQVGVNAGGIYYGFQTKANNPGNAYALIFVPDNPLTALTQAQINKLAYADCVPTATGGMMAGGGMMGSVCMTGTSIAGYGAIGTMSGYPVAQAITAVPTPAVPEPETYAMFMAGLGLIGLIARRRKPA